MQTSKSLQLLLLLTLLQHYFLVNLVQAYHRMSIAVNASTVNPHYWYRQSQPPLPSWYYQSNNYYRNYKVFHLQFLSQTDVRCNDGTRAG